VVVETSFQGEKLATLIAPYRKLDHAPAGHFLTIATDLATYAPAMSLLAMVLGKGPSGFGYGSTAEDVTEGLSLDGKTILVTGCNSGLGLETVRVLAKRGARVIGAARTEAKAKEATEGLKGSFVPVACELSDPASVKACVATVSALEWKLDAIICNAGIMMLPKLQTAHGYELQFFTNHIGHFILVTGLLDRLTDDGRVVMLSSEGHKQAPKVGIELDNLNGQRGYGGLRMYGQSKLANLLFAKELSRRFDGTKRTANAVHPGVIATNLGRHLNPLATAALWVARPLVLKTVEQGAATQVYAATHPSLHDVTGQYLASSNLATPRPDADDPVLARKLWDASEKIAAEVTATN
jgi:NAD(P)-dependent dehydrogenase (short-subunit alcohol dehydrogenase family)